MYFISGVVVTTTISKMQNSKFSGKGIDLVGGTAYDKGPETVEDFILRSKLNFCCFFCTNNRLVIKVAIYIRFFGV